MTAKHQVAETGEEARDQVTSKRYSLGARLLALGLGVGLAIVCAEFGYRLLRTAALSPTTHPTYVSYDAELGWSYKPGKHARHRSDEFDVEIHINSHGFRGAEWPQPAADRKRVLVLGDSFAFGWGVNQEETFAARLAQAEPTWDIFNAGVSGFGTDQELLVLRKLRDELRPDLVLCYFCPNDVLECSGPVAYGRHKPYFVQGPQGLELRGTPVPRPFLERISQLWGAFVKYRWERAQSDATRDVASDWRLILALLQELARESQGAPVLILSESNQFELLAAQTTLHQFDLGPALEELGASAHFPIDGHLTPAGHAQVARAVHERVRELLRSSGAQ